MTKRLAHKKSSSLPGSLVLGTAGATADFGRRLVRLPKRPHVWLLRGQLGSGKTTLVRSVVRALGVRQTVTSPTFSLVKRYRLRRQPWRWVVHVDAYRVRGRHEIAALELNEAVADPTTLLLVEWPERLRGVRWGNHLHIALSHRRHGRRAIVRLRRR